ncbi:hypothetical protein [Oceanobacillus timonensis]|uniref:hypothetical protein n=1 Tax=Oceanobacillus timonensis TaxID=1926285 RepID=UPI0009B97F86|nr:hypothetical protein [Oceanobacillus timonensis]
MDDKELLKNVFDNQVSIEQTDYRIKDHKEAIENVNKDLAESYDFEIKSGALSDESFAGMAEDKVNNFSKEIEKEEAYLSTKRQEEAQLKEAVQDKGYEWDDYLKENKVNGMIEAYTAGGMSYEESYDFVHSEEAGLEELKNAINEFHVEEFDISDEESIKELNQNDVVPLVHSSLGDSDELHVQTFLNVSEKRLEKVVSGDYLEEVEYLNYDSIQEIIEDLEENEFDYFIELDEIDKEELIEKNNAYTVSEEQIRENTDTLGTIMYEPNNKAQQSLLVENLKTGKNHEYAINNMNIQSKGRQIPLSQMLDSKNLTEMNHSIKNNEPTSFMLNKNEMQKVEQQGLKKGLETNIPDNKQEALLELKEQYTSFQHALKEESKGELTEEKVINRMEIENKYNSSKTEVTETYPESKETIQMMEKNVRSQQVKSNQNNLSM